MIRGRWIFAVLLLSHVAANAEPKQVVTVDDFAYGYMLETPDGASVYSVPLPVEVYRTVRQPNLGDLRVFNAQGQVVPHARLRPAAEKEQVSRYVLPIFPVRGNLPANEKFAVRVIRYANGAIMEIRNDLPSVKDAPIVSYILDTSLVDTELARLYVQWKDTAGFVATVTVSASEDLNYWRTIKSRAALAELVHGDERLVRNEIAMEPVKSKYLRLEWNAPGQAVELSGIEADAAAKTRDPVPVWVTLEGRTETDKGGNTYAVFDTGGGIPTERGNLVLADANSLVRVSIFSRPDEKSEWRPRHRGLFYRLNDEKSQAEFRNDAFTLGRTTDQWWRVEAAAEDGASTGAKLEIGWLPERITFLARGSGPYQMAFGSAVATGAEQPVAELLHTLHQRDTRLTPTEARIGERVVLGGDSRLSAGPAPLPWRRIVLWVVLVAGVALLAAMALGLIRQIDSTKPD